MYARSPRPPGGGQNTLTTPQKAQTVKSSTTSIIAKQQPNVKRHLPRSDAPPTTKCPLGHLRRITTSTRYKASAMINYICSYVEYCKAPKRDQLAKKVPTLNCAKMAEIFELLKLREKIRSIIEARFARVKKERKKIFCFFLPSASYQWHSQIGLDLPQGGRGVVNRQKCMYDVCMHVLRKGSVRPLAVSHLALSNNSTYYKGFYGYSTYNTCIIINIDSMFKINLLTMHHSN